MECKYLCITYCGVMLRGTLQDLYSIPIPTIVKKLLTIGAVLELVGGFNCRLTELLLTSTICCQHNFGGPTMSNFL